MNYFIVLFGLALVGWSTAAVNGYPRGCIYALGKCIRECEVGTHAYTTGCGRKAPEPTCDDPYPVLEEGIICDYSACYCDMPNLRDTTTNKCVPPEECPKKN